MPEPTAIPDQFISGMLTGFGMSMDDLSEREVLCLRGVVGSIDPVKLTNSLDDPISSGELLSGMISCVPDLFVVAMIAPFGLGIEDLSREEASCLRELVGSTEATSMAALFSDDLVVNANFAAAQVACLPDLFISGIISELGLSMEDLSQEETSCLREWVYSIDETSMMALIAADSAAVAGFVNILASCVPDYVVSLMLFGTGLNIDDLSQKEVSCLRELATGIDWTLIAESPDTGAETVESAAGLISCVPDLIISEMLTAYGLSIEDLNQEQVSCSREMTEQIDWSAVFAADDSVLFAALDELEEGLISCIQNPVGG